MLAWNYYEGGIGCNGKPKDTRTTNQNAALVMMLQKFLDCYLDARIVGHCDLSLDRDHNGIIEPNEWIKVCPYFDATVQYAYLTSNIAQTEKLKQLAEKTTENLLN